VKSRGGRERNESQYAARKRGTTPKAEWKQRRKEKAATMANVKEALAEEKEKKKRKGERKIKEEEKKR